MRRWTIQKGAVSRVYGPSTGLVVVASLLELGKALPPCETCGGSGEIHMGAEVDFDSGMLDVDETFPCPDCGERPPCERCRHPNHGQPDHDCAPFRPGCGEKLAETQGAEQHLQSLQAAVQAEVEALRAEATERKLKTPYGLQVIADRLEALLQEETD